MFLILKLQTWVHPESVFRGLCKEEMTLCTLLEICADVKKGGADYFSTK